MAGFVQRAAREPNRLRFESEVTAVDGSVVRLKDTYFFAASGGQPRDRGTIAGIPVVDVRLEDGAIVHELETTADLDPGETVRGEVDGAFRQYCRRAHTASHVIYGAARQLLQDLGSGGFEIDERKVRIDFESATPIDDETLISLESLANEAVWDSRDVTWEQRSYESVIEDEAIAFNAATEDIVDTNDTVRIVEVEGWDLAACGGTHVENTATIGPITVLERSNPGSGLTRVEFAVGPIAVDRLRTLHETTTEASGLLDVSPERIPDGIRSLTDRIETSRERIAELEHTLVSERLDSFETIETGEHRWKIGHLPDVDTDRSAAALRTAIGANDISMLVGVTGDERTTLQVASTGEIGAERVVATVTEEFGGGGGGSEEMAQGGGVPRSPDDVLAYLRSSATEFDE